MNNDLNDIDQRDESRGKEILLEELLGSMEVKGQSARPSDFDSDAAEGLGQMDPAQVPLVIGQLNRSLNKQLKKKNKKAALPDQAFVYITVITVMVLVIIAYFVVSKFQGK